MTRPQWLVMGALLLAAACGGAKGGDGDTAGLDVVGDTAGGHDTTGTDTGNPDDRPPTLFKIGDKVVAVGQPLEIQMKAEDPDGDALAFSIYGDVPRDAQFLKDVGQFKWTPTAEFADKSFYLTFVVSEAANPEMRDRETIEVAVTAEAEAHAPVFQALGDQTVQAGQTWQGQLVATDPDGGTLAYSVGGVSPQGFALDGATGAIEWAVPAGTEGETYAVAFVVSDGGLSDQMTVNFVVAGGTGNHAPVFAPQADVEVVAGQKASFVVTATDADNDPLTYGTGSALPQGATFDAAAHRFDWTPTDAQAGKAYTVTFTASDGTLGAVLEVGITVNKQPAGSCSADAKEPNDTDATAKPLADGDALSLTLCPKAGVADLDWFRVTVKAGDHLTVTTHTDGDLNIDLDLYEQGTSTEPAAFGWSDGADETLTYTAGAAGDVYVAAYQWGGDPTSDSGAYLLTAEVQGGAACSNDAYEPNQTLAAPHALAAADLGKDLSAQICPGDVDVYSFDVPCGASVSAAIFFTHAQGDLDLYLYGPTGDTALASGATDGDGEMVDVGAQPDGGTYRVKVAGFPEASTQNAYTLVVETSGGGACGGDACTLTSCDMNKVCDADAGCVSDYCTTDYDCPTSYVCLDTFCVDACTSVSDCRPDYGCKIFEDGRYCAPAGSALLGDACSYTSDCSGDLVCRLLYDGGMCTRYGCPAKACPSGSLCSDSSDGKICAPKCTTDGDCRDGFTCKSNGSGKVCLP